MIRKYRAWNTIEERWATVAEIERLVLVNAFANGGGFQLDENKHNGLSGDLTTLKLISFTGLKDKNQTEIYEGDIVRQEYHAETGSYDDSMSFDGHHIGQVVITATKGVCMKNPFCYSEETDETNISNQYKRVAGYRSKVIGNIYENSELLRPEGIETNELPSGAAAV